MEKMIEFVLSRVPLRLLSFYPSKSDHLAPLSTHAPCWAVKVNLQTCSLIFFSFPCLSLSSSSFFSFLLCFFCPTHIIWEFVFLLRVLLPHSTRKDFLLLHFRCTSFDEMTNPVSSRWCLTLSQKSPATPSRDKVRPLVKGSLSTGFPFVEWPTRVWGVPVGKWLQSHYSSSKALPEPVRHSPSAAVHLCSHSS